MKIRQLNYEIFDDRGSAAYYNYGPSNVIEVSSKPKQYKFKVIEQYDTLPEFEAKVEKFLNDGYRLYGNLDQGLHGRYHVSLIKEL